MQYDMLIWSLIPDFSKLWFVLPEKNSTKTLWDRRADVDQYTYFFRVGKKTTLIHEKLHTFLNIELQFMDDVIVFFRVYFIFQFSNTHFIYTHHMQRYLEISFIPTFLCIFWDIFTISMISFCIHTNMLQNGKTFNTYMASFHFLLYKHKQNTYQ